jgi:hypothetical protein
MGTDNMRFHAPVYPGDSIFVETLITSKKQTRKGWMCEYDWTIKNQDDVAVATGTIYDFSRLTKGAGCTRTVKKNKVIQNRPETVFQDGIRLQRGFRLDVFLNSFFYLDLVPALTVKRKS